MLKKVLSGLLAAVICLVVLAAALPVTARAAGPLDRIDEYEITVLPREDGTLDIRYVITWTVLDSVKEGPLEWVKVGIPNMHVDEITALTDNITKARYYADGGAYVRLDLDRKYREGESLTFSFSIHQSHMIILGDNSVTYEFTPGWFDEIAVKKIQVRWSAADVASSDSQKKENGMLLWSGSLEPGEKFPVQVIYSRSAFPTLNPEDTYTTRYEAAWKIALVAGIVVLILGVIALCAFLAERNSDNYAYYRGFTGGSTRVYVGGVYPMIHPGVGRGGVGRRLRYAGGGAGRRYTGRNTTGAGLVPLVVKLLVGP